MEERAKWEKRAEGRDRGCERLREAGEARGRGRPERAGARGGAVEEGGEGRREPG